MFNIRDEFDLLYLVAVLGLVLIVASIPTWLIARLVIGLWAIWQEREAQSRTHRANAAMAEASAERAYLDNALVHPNMDGMLPIARAAVLASTDHILELMAAYQDRMRPPANVPASLHYAPHMIAAKGKEQPMYAQIEEQPALPAFEVKDLWQLWHADQLPTDGFLLGHNLLTCEPIIAGWMQLYSALVGGTSGSGKSTLIRSVLLQAALQNGRFVVLDRHFGAGPESLGASLQPLRGRMPFDVAGNERQMVDALRYVLDVGRRRLNGDPDRTPLIMVVDETTALFQRSEIAGELAMVLGEISQETRKAGVYALCIGQNFSAEVMKTTVRNSFASFFSCRTRRDVARVMSGNTAFAQAAEGLKIGQAVWLDTGGEVVTLAVPNCTQRHVELVARQIQEGHYSTEPAGYLPEVDQVQNQVRNQVRGGQVWSVGEPENNQAANHVPNPVDPRAARVAQMLEGGATFQSIIDQVWGVKGKGEAWQVAMNELRQLIAGSMRR